ncbi:MAG TPA: extracellular solute-binding protein [Trebonia sp.]|jgi:iron(III) transport system substrate-binding protein|nr:extracellular solute-binding protein [Trebonia sp.]
MNRTHQRTRLRLLAVVSGAVALSVVTVAGCSSSSSSSSSAPASSSPAAASSSAAASATTSASAAAAATVPLVLYSAQGYDSAMSKAFTKATGIPVSLDDNSTGPLLTQIEASKNNPKWGLLWVDGATAFAGLDTQGLLLKGFEPSVTWNSLGTASVPADKSYVPTGVTVMGILAYNKTKVPHPPTTWQALLSSTWKGQVGMNDPSQSGPTFPLIAGVMNYLGGVPAGEKYFTTLKSNGLVIHPTNGPTLQALTSGQINLALVQSSAAIGATFTDKNIGISYLDPATLLPSALGIDAKAPAAEQAEAEKFIEYVLSPAGQKVMQSGDPTGDSLYYPVVSGVSPLPALPSLASVKTQTINPYTWGPQEATVNTWFDSTVVR